jgi:hypothetical protein
MAPVGRFQLLPAPLMLPGVCACCGAGNKPVIDFGLQLEWHGAVYLCIDCITEAGTVVGLVPSARYEAVLEDLVKLKAPQVEVQNAISEYIDRQRESAISFFDRLSIISNGAPADSEEIDGGSGKSDNVVRQGNNFIIDERSTSVSTSSRNNGSAFDL